MAWLRLEASFMFVFPEARNLDPCAIMASSCSGSRESSAFAPVTRAPPAKAGSS
eukprot:CAMPEP_0175598704 /NCGR_PEP_ID=MMETSP0096-20121207/56688_1 /TAXON_ID=311494 /ORGANISM="Alexandrium monilatum, Strain CCMP3105" /LENGTH=53 /DNA_ID=CAMNT_0016903213 /DNA_START=27 /DNA_END=185 /DNA_ORIENTATION=-